MAHKTAWFCQNFTDCFIGNPTERAGLESYQDWGAAALIQAEAYLNGAQTLGRNSGRLMGWTLAFRGVWAFETARSAGQILIDRVRLGSGEGIDDCIAFTDMYHAR